MKRKALSAIIALAMVISLFAIPGISAAAAGYEVLEPVSWATGYEAGTPVPSGTINDTAAADRKNLTHTLGIRDAIGYTDATGELNKSIASMRYYDQVKFTFGDADNFLIGNNPDDYDIQLFEATVGGWHPEAVEIILTNAIVLNDDGEEESAGDLSIGIGLNNVGLMLLAESNVANGARVSPLEADPRYADGDEDLIGMTFAQACDARGLVIAPQVSELDGSTTFTRVEMPENLVSADGIILVDKTATLAKIMFGKTLNGVLMHTYEINGAMYKYLTWTGKNDGFDLDAISAPLITAIPDYQGAIDAYKFHDVNMNGFWNHETESPLGDYEFQLLMLDAATGDYVAIPATDPADADGIEDRSFVTSAAADGNIRFGDWAPGKYKIVEINIPASMRQTSYSNGAVVEVLNQQIDNVIYYAQDGVTPLGFTDLGDLIYPEFGNVERCITWDGNQTAYAAGEQNGHSSWSMSVPFDGADKTVDLMRGQNTDVGDVTIVDNGDGNLTVTVTMNELCRMTQIHWGVFDKLTGHPPGKLPIKPAGTFTTYTGTAAYTGGLVYVEFHCEVQVGSYAN